MRPISGTTSGITLGAAFTLSGCAAAWWAATPTARSWCSSQPLIANFGTKTLEHQNRDSSFDVVLDALHGQPLGRTNFVLRDRRGPRRQDPWIGAGRERIADGYVGVIDANGARLGTTEIRFDPDKAWLHVVETSGAHISRLDVAEWIRRDIFAVWQRRESAARGSGWR